MKSPIRIPDGADPVAYLRSRIADYQAALTEWRQRAWKGEREREEARSATRGLIAESEEAWAIILRLEQEREEARTFCAEMNKRLAEHGMYMEPPWSREDEL
jgi:hypothetical protein